MAVSKWMSEKVPENLILCFVLAVNEIITNY